MDFDTATFKWKIWYYDCFFIYYLSNRNRTMRQISMIRYWQSGKLAWCIYKNTLSHYDCHRILGIVCSFCIEIFRAHLRHSTFNKWSVDSKEYTLIDCCISALQNKHQPDFMFSTAEFAVAEQAQVSLIWRFFLFLDHTLGDQWCFVNPIHFSTLLGC